MKTYQRCEALNLSIERMFHLGTLLAVPPLGDGDDSIEALKENDILGLPWWKENVVENHQSEFLGASDLYELLSDDDIEVDAFVVQVGLAKRDRFTFSPDGEFCTGCNEYPGNRYMQYAYGKTFDEAMSRAISWADGMARSWEDKAREEQGHVR